MANKIRGFSMTGPIVPKITYAHNLYDMLKMNNDYLQFSCSLVLMKDIVEVLEFYADQADAGQRAQEIIKRLKSNDPFRKESGDGQD